MTGAWLGPAAGNGDACVRLFCFAHAGGGSGFFQPWRSVLAPEIELRPVILPGRETRFREPPYDRVVELLDPLIDALLPHTDRPYALFGHSLGSILAYEVARRLQAAAAAPPTALFVSGRRAPHLPARRAPLHQLPEERFVEAMTKLNGTPEAVLRQGDLLKLFLPMLRADFKLNETYQHLPGPRLCCPVSALTGDADPEVDLEEMAAWRETTGSAFVLRVFRGDHFYLKGVPEELLAAMRADLRRLCSLPA